jgi:sec-independent protein translocase protein TatB
MFDIGATELLMIVIVAVVVIGPKDLPAALRTAGRWMARVRRVSGHFRAGVDAMIREAEMEEMEKKWAEQNARIMAKYPAGEGVAGTVADAPPPVSAEARAANAAPAPPPAEGDEPQLPLPPR